MTTVADKGSRSKKVDWIKALAVLKVGDSISMKSFCAVRSTSMDIGNGGPLHDVEAQLFGGSDKACWELLHITEVLDAPNI